jgi:hypothetical protein
MLDLIRSYKEAATDLALSPERHLAALAARVSDARQALRRDLSPPEHFNLFDILRVRRLEYVHSNVLAWLLDPLDNHGGQSRSTGREEQCFPTVRFMSPAIVGKDMLRSQLRERRS